MSESFNPYQTPSATVDDVVDTSNPHAEAIRKEHINHEASIKAVGTLYYLSTLGVVVAGLTFLFMPAAYAGADMSGAVGGVVMLAIAVGLFMVARGLRAIRPWVRIPAVLLSVLGLLGFPVGTLINGYVIWLLLSKKGRLILSSEYDGIVQATPHIKYRTSIVVWILLGLILLVLVAAIVLPMFRG